MHSRVFYGLIYLAAFMSLGHHVDHMIRGNHVGWPLTEQATPFTYSLGIYPLIALGLFLYSSGRVGPGFWALTLLYPKTPADAFLAETLEWGREPP